MFLGQLSGNLSAGDRESGRASGPGMIVDAVWATVSREQAGNLARKQGTGLEKSSPSFEEWHGEHGGVELALVEAPMLGPWSVTDFGATQMQARPS